MPGIMTPSFPLAASITAFFPVFGADFWLLAIQAFSLEEYEL
jgi:hypothetical protein